MRTGDILVTASWTDGYLRIRPGDRFKFDDGSPFGLLAEARAPLDRLERG